MAEAPMQARERGDDKFVVSHLRKRIDPAIAWAFGCIALVLLVGSLYSSSFLSPQYLLQQLKVASFLGVIATGAMIVILLGQGCRAVWAGQGAGHRCGRSPGHRE